MSCRCRTRGRQLFAGWVSTIMERSVTEPPSSNPVGGNSSLEEESENLFSRGNRTSSKATHNERTRCPVISVKIQNCETCNMTKTSRARCPSAETVWNSQRSFGQVIAAGHRVPSEECCSFLQHRFAVVVQDFFSYQIQTYPTMSNNGRDRKDRLQQFHASLRHTLTNFH